MQSYEKKPWIRCFNEIELKKVVKSARKQRNEAILKVLDINCEREIGIDCAALIANLFEVNTSLTDLEFGPETICNNGVRVIVDALIYYNNTTLTFL